jgi:hypothetical protein
VESFPERDRGIYKPGEAPGVVEEDPLEAAVKKMKMRKDQKIKDKAIKEASQKEKRDRKVKFADEKGSSDEDSAEYFESDEGKDEDDEDYDSEDDEESDDDEEEKAIDGVQIVKAKKEDAMRELEKAQRLKPAPGVKFTRYDQFGVPIEPDAETGFDYQKHIARGDLAPGEGMYIEASPEMVA